MNTKTEINQSNGSLAPLMVNSKHTFKAYLIDLATWAYMALISYKIVYQRLILQERYPEFNWNQPKFSLLVGAVFALLFFFIPKGSIGKAITQRDPESSEQLSWKYPFVIVGATGILLSLIAGVNLSQISIEEFFSESGIQGATRIFTALINPNWAIFEEALFAAIETIYMAFLATTVAVPVAFLLSFFAARNLTIRSRFLFFIYTVVRLSMNLTRAVEPLVWAIIFSVWVGIGPFAGMLALCLHSVASLTKLYSEQIENIDDGPIEAMTATGAHPVQVIWFGIVPQVFLPFLSYTIYRWDINVRMATVIGLVGGGGIGTMLMQYQGLAKWSEVGLLVIVIAVVVWAMDYTSARIREAIK